MGNVAVIFILIFWVLMLIPCLGIGWLGKQLIDRLGTHPSKTPAIQMSIMFKLILIEVVSVTLILGFFKALVAE